MGPALANLAIQICFYLLTVFTLPSFACLAPRGSCVMFQTQQWAMETRSYLFWYFSLLISKENVYQKIPIQSGLQPRLGHMQTPNRSLARRKVFPGLFSNSVVKGGPPNQSAALQQGRNRNGCFRVNRGPLGSRLAAIRILDDSTVRQKAKGHHGGGFLGGNCKLHLEVGRQQQQRHMNDAISRRYGPEKRLFLFG